MAILERLEAGALLHVVPRSRPGMTPPAIVNKGYQHLDGIGNDDRKGREGGGRQQMPSPRLVARESAGVLHFALYPPIPGDHAPALF